MCGASMKSWWREAVFDVRRGLDMGGDQFVGSFVVFESRIHHINLCERGYGDAALTSAPSNLPTGIS